MNISWGLALLAILYLTVMAYGERLHNHDDAQHHHNSSAGYGLLEFRTEAVKEIVVTHNGIAREFQRLADGWSENGASLASESSQIIDELVRMVKTAEPVRTFMPEDLVTASAKEYGINSNSSSIKLITASASELPRLVFGNATVDGNLRYVAKSEDASLYVMSGFIYSQLAMVSEIAVR